MLQLCCFPSVVWVVSPGSVCCPALTSCQLLILSSAQVKGTSHMQLAQLMMVLGSSRFLYPVCKVLSSSHKMRRAQKLCSNCTAVVAIPGAQAGRMRVRELETWSQNPCHGDAQVRVCAIAIRGVQAKRMGVNSMRNGHKSLPQKLHLRICAIGDAYAGGMKVDEKTDGNKITKPLRQRLNCALV